MRLLLVRHAVAHPRGHGPDAARRLTARGARRFSRSARGLARLGFAPDALLASPLVRAQETAAFLAAAFKIPIDTADALAAPPTPAMLQELERGALILVGHEPWLGELCAWLVAGARELAPAFAFKKGGAAWLDGQPTSAGMRLVAFLPPRLTRDLARLPAK